MKVDVSLSIIWTAWITVFGLLFLFSLPVYAQPVPEEVLQGLTTSNSYTEPDGLTRWAQEQDGTIIKYHLGRDDVHKIYYPDGGRKVYSSSGELLLDEMSDGSAAIYDEMTGELSHILEEDYVATYEDGIRVRVEEEAGVESNNTVTFVGNGTYQIKEGDAVMLVGVDDANKVVRVRHSTSFKKDFETRIPYADEGHHELELRLLDPVSDDVYWRKIVTVLDGEEKKPQTESKGLKYTLQSLWIRWFNAPRTPEEAQVLFDKYFIE